MMFCQNCLEQAGECICAAIRKGSVDRWFAVKLKPTDSRRIRMKFMDGSESDGFFWRAEGLWYLSEGSKAARNAVDPIEWAESKVSL